jgi:hypothetical protein
LLVSFFFCLAKYPRKSIIIRGILRYYLTFRFIRLLFRFRALETYIPSRVLVAYHVHTFLDRGVALFLIYMWQHRRYVFSEAPFLSSAYRRILLRTHT